MSKEFNDRANRTAQNALLYWTRSAAQGDTDAMVKLGDFYFNGWGVDEPAHLRQEKAAGYYQAAIDSHSSIAMWNIGWMYENGMGVPQVQSIPCFLFTIVTELGIYRTFISPKDIMISLSNIITTPTFPLSSHS